MTDLPLIRSHERIQFKRCQKAWYWHWRRGLTPKNKSFGATDLGTWMHTALAWRYTTRDTASLEACFDMASAEALLVAEGANAPDYEIEKGQELRQLGLAMSAAYDRFYGSDPGVNVIDAEIPLEIEITDPAGKVIALHKFKPDLLYADDNGDAWLMEHKTAKQIALEHLPIDDQARPYVAMAEIALRRGGYLRKNQVFKGVNYNFLRKALPDEREMNAEGKYLNKDGSVSKRQPTPIFIRHPVVLSNKSKALALRRLRMEAALITGIREDLISGEMQPDLLGKTPHKSCPKLCDYFTMCRVEEEGGDIREMERTMYVRQDPYAYDEESADVIPTFELG